MESYQFSNDHEELHLSMSMNEAALTKSKGSIRFWTYTAVISIVSAIFILAYSSNTSTLLMTSEQRISLAKRGRGPMTFTDLTTDEKKMLFEEFKSKFDRKYESVDEENLRFNNFLNSLEKAQARNDNEAKLGGTAIHGVTKFSDRSDDEFKQLLGYRRPDITKKNKIAVVTVTIDDYDLSTASTTADWSTSLTTGIKDQGYCGSCWAFSSVSQIESDAIRAGYLTTDDKLSEQQLVSCDYTDYGCDGGYTEYAYEYVYSAGGLVSDSSYPYTSYYDQSGKCSLTSKMTQLVTVSEYYALDSEETMAAHVLTTGPLSVCLDGSEWLTYVSGVVSSCGDDVDHCVQVVGINKDESYWKVRNSWGTEWGMDGYILLEYGSNLCDIASDPTYVLVTNLQ